MLELRYVSLFNLKKDLYGLNTTEMISLFYVTGIEVRNPISKSEG
ncbi:hypothetical protein CSP5_1238 [Cuniculiplasma divulgatum]|jgi:hypothetical protein|uniref:Uncharacterized protein n=1 Tax=Cuniculiplasma divulgatum TaxID=1673428 RepID=A0A1N5V4Z0_9ARCH|nr:hypothetical protein CSP5_1238 [Cuniculiplasma divulgatum]SJK85043.1 hypothetical protein CPM_1240 [Cuniculiplasma divulgatum]